jgi:hypothetical protein
VIVIAKNNRARGTIPRLFLFADTTGFRRLVFAFGFVRSDYRFLTSPQKT